ncbi:MAG: cobyrinate a,c-diamide synthase [Elainellaceae cyanobacterium]
MALIIAGDRSGVGKTTITLALLACLRHLFPHQRVQSFKVGPDYIDPMFHAAITGRACRNLDPVLTSEGYVRQCFTSHSQTAHYSLVEGVMGLFDGAGATDTASTAHVAKLLGLPVLLVLDAQRTSRSIAALVHGFRSFDPDVTLAGVVLNRVGSDRHRELLEAVMRSIGMPVLGVLGRETAIAIPSRHLGLVPTAELTLQPVLERLIQLGKAAFDWARLLPLLTSPTRPLSAQPLQQEKTQLTPEVQEPSQPPLRLALASDAAFSFYYADNLDLLSHQAEIVPWSPLRGALPANIHGLYLGGGFPEVFADELAANQAALSQLRQLAGGGLPIYAECGGLMYLCETLTDLEGTPHPMAGLIPAIVAMGARLTLGYRRATALADTPLVAPSAVLWGHEFHHSQVKWRSPLSPSAATPALAKTPLFALRRFDQLPHQPPLAHEGWHTSTLHASYLHLHWGATPHLPQRFLRNCRCYADQNHVLGVM